MRTLKKCLTVNGELLVSKEKSTRFIFLLEVTHNRETYSTDVAIDAFHRVKTPVIDDPTALAVARQIDPNLGKEDSNVIYSMTLRKSFNGDRLYGPLMVSLPVVDDTDEESRACLNAYVSLLRGEELAEFIRTSKI